MYILSLILTTIISGVNAVGTVLMACGGFNYSMTNPTAGVIPRNIFPLAYDFLVPATLVMLILSFTVVKPDKKTKAPLFLKLSFLLSLIQIVVTVFLYQTNISYLKSEETLPIALIIIEGAVIALTFILGIACAIKATDSKLMFQNKAKLFAILALILGASELLIDVLTGVIFKIDAASGVAQEIYRWMGQIRMINPAIFALAVLNTIRRPDKYTVIAWAGAIFAFLGHIVVYILIYI
ncbi:hypothetical protein IJG78_01235 [Candidatus Saccharibacteria bacterium]|nr:hypothetical protein [Candidatus Saccharibacteria bacterium]